MSSLLNARDFVAPPFFQEWSAFVEAETRPDYWEWFVADNTYSTHISHIPCDLCVEKHVTCKLYPFLKVVLEFWSSGVLDRSSGSGIKFKRPVAIADREDRAESDRSSEGKVLDNRLRNIYYRETVFIVELASYQEVQKRVKEGVKAASKECR
ncbi:hypothetical protein CC1G_10958 [Coprinopsis cinerea okayama7|uniref:Uncharacterized protein n=1 Tax=Coprinopsis cinerea (strain Okayama-7 / 130 / ATCC MYA-4618 / FGSC 9003) TaxID=240176 RepID=A8PBZ3_COPC7|nr:hypothetical protein CC1G_10958 [Coprinopsis cinerea okayama7\|eukprot:XP_001840295.2 hypothetical protein CC1G_10958 [Coprinopsis cinerea okayama7\